MSDYVCESCGKPFTVDRVSDTRVCENCVVGEEEMDAHSDGRNAERSSTAEANDNDSADGHDVVPPNDAVRETSHSDKDEEHARLGFRKAKASETVIGADFAKQPNASKEDSAPVLLKPSTDVEPPPKTTIELGGVQNVAPPVMSEVAPNSFGSTLADQQQQRPGVSVQTVELPEKMKVSAEKIEEAVRSPLVIMVIVGLSMIACVIAIVIAIALFASLGFVGS